MRATLRLAVMALFLIGLGPEFADAQNQPPPPPARRLNVVIPIRPTRWWARGVGSSERCLADWLKC